MPWIIQGLCIESIQGQLQELTKQEKYLVFSAIHRQVQARSSVRMHSLRAQLMPDYIVTLHKLNRLLGKFIQCGQLITLQLIFDDVIHV